MKENIRPWGKYKVLAQIKEIVVKPNKRLSLQYHNNRSEEWKIMKGTGTVQIDDNIYKVKKDMKFFIDVGVIHRLKAGPKGITIREFSEGDVEEDDIVRMEDDYGR